MYAIKSMRVKQEECERLYQFGEALGMSRLRTMKRQAYKLAILSALLSIEESMAFGAELVATKATPIMQRTCPISTQQAARVMRMLNVKGHIIATKDVGDISLVYRLSDSFLVAKRKYWSEQNEN